MKTNQYLTAKNLQDIGFTQDSNSLQSILDAANQKIADRINAEIPVEIEHNYDEGLLMEYLELVGENGFSSEVTQDWLERHIAAFGEIVTDHVNIMLADLREGLFPELSA
jgi:hypothetical protein